MKATPCACATVCAWAPGAPCTVHTLEQGACGSLESPSFPRPGLAGPWRDQPSSRFWNTSPACSRRAWNLIFGQLLSMARSSGAYSTSTVGASTAS